LLNGKEAALRSMATEELYQKQGCGSYLMKLLEQWITKQGQKIIRIHAPLDAKLFYQKRGYILKENRFSGLPSDNLKIFSQQRS
jgi:GNAT superfamily N-acetyltransferase